MVGCNAAIHGGNIDNSAIVVLDHILGSLSCHQEVSCDRCVNDFLPFRERELCGGADFDVSGDIYKNVNLAIVIDNFLNAVDDLLLYSDVAYYRKAFSAIALQNALPNPEDAPVMIATRPVKSI